MIDLQWSYFIVKENRHMTKKIITIITAVIVTPVEILLLGKKAV